MRERIFTRGPVAAALLALAVAGIVGAAAVALVTDDEGKGSPTVPGEVPPVAAVASLAPRIALFGDTVTAHVDVTVDRTQLDPGLVHVEARFGRWSRVGAPAVERNDSGGITYLRTTYVLRCLSALCVPTREAGEYEFASARVSYEAPQGDASERHVVDAHWPVLVVHSRLGASGPSERDPLAAPWRADVFSLPSVTYRIRPALLTGLLLAGGIALLAAAAVLVYRALPRRSDAPPPLPPPPPKPVLSPLEQALLVLETRVSENGVSDRRRALELVADELSGWDDHTLERTARMLAWSEDEPGADATRALAAGVRAQIEEHSNGRPA